MFFKKPDRDTLLAIWQQARGNHQVTCNHLARMERILMSMMDDVKAKMAHMTDVVNAAVAVIAQLDAAIKYLKGHEDPALKDVGNSLDTASKNLADQIAKVSVSGSVG